MFEILCWFNDNVSPKRKTYDFLNKFSLSGTANYFLQLGALLAGIALSVYLLVQHTELRSGIQASASFCSVASFADCDVVNASDYSEILGVPLAALGALFYFFLFLLALLFPIGQKGHAWGQGWIGRLGLLALLIDVHLFCIQAFVLRNFCIMCLSTYVVSALVFLTAFWSYEKKDQGVGFYLKSILGPKFAPSPGVGFSSALLGLLALCSFTLALWLIPPAILIHSPTYDRINQALEIFFEQWKDIPGKKIPTKDTDARSGNATSGIQIVEFSDFQCPHCQRAAFTFHTAMKALKDKAEFVFKHFPLDSACNATVKKEIHPHACSLARLGVCLQKQGKFWQFHDAVFFDWAKEGHSSSNAVLDSIVGGSLSTVTDQATFQNCMKDPETLAAVKEDIALGLANGVDGTPAVFLNGKRVAIPITLDNLKRLIEIESSLK